MSERAHRDYESAKIGMWLFLFTEILLFGGLFLLYSVYRYRYSLPFHDGAVELDLLYGTLNTVILLTSSLSIAASIVALKKGDVKFSVVLQLVTVLLGMVFLVNKYFEWSTKIRHGIYPGSERLLSMGDGKALFFGLYYTMTGLHGVHVLVGVVVIGIMAVLTGKGKIGPGDYVKLENTGLYWHLVDVIWIYLFPLFYLIT